MDIGIWSGNPIRDAKGGPFSQLQQKEKCLISAVPAPIVICHKPAPTPPPSHVKAVGALRYAETNKQSKYNTFARTT